MTAAVPEPRRPVCHRHTRWMASCSDCRDAHRSTDTHTTKEQHA